MKLKNGPKRNPSYDGKGKLDGHIQKLEEILHLIQETIKIGNVYDAILTRIVEFVNEVKSIEEHGEHENRPSL